MNGLDEILKKISDDSDEQIAAINSASKKEVDDFLASKRDEAASVAKTIVEDAKVKAAQIAENSKSGCAAVLRREELKTKSEIINEWINNAVKNAENSPVDTYFNYIEKLILRYYHKGEGIIRFNKNDLERMPADFISTINGKLENGSVSIGEQIDIKSGFVLVYGSIEENCSFDALLSSESDVLRDKLIKLID